MQDRIIIMAISKEVIFMTNEMMDALMFSCYILIGISWVKIALLENKLKNIHLDVLLKYLEETYGLGNRG